MSDTIWIKHPDLDGLAEVPAASLPTWRGSGWDKASQKDIDAHAKAQAGEQAATEQDLLDRAAQPNPDTDTDSPDTAAERRDPKES